MKLRLCFGSPLETSQQKRHELCWIIGLVIVRGGAAGCHNITTASQFCMRTQYLSFVDMPLVPPCFIGAIFQTSEDSKLLIFPINAGGCCNTRDQPALPRVYRSFVLIGLFLDLTPFSGALPFPTLAAAWMLPIVRWLSVLSAMLAGWRGDG